MQNLTWRDKTTANIVWQYVGSLPKANLPDSLDLDSKDLSMIIATKLYEQGKLSLGQAADLAGLTKRTFAGLLAKYDISIFNFPATDIARDVANA